ncbi:MAG: FecR family protein, partial [Myxococcota bacterium]|nr:FecR family protein [Myxococcota bacterium]
MDQVELDADYEAMVARARQALDAMPDLPASRWVAIRSGIDEGIGRSRAVGTGWAWIAVAIAVAATLVLAQRPVSAPPLSLEHLVTAPVAPKKIETQPVRPAPPVIASGAVLVAGSTPENYEAFGRHRLTLEPGARVEVVAWSKRDLAVRLTAGRVIADIAKAFPGERIQIETTTSVVRVVGTRFSVSYDASGATQVAVTEGTVEVRDKGDAE